MPLDTRRVAEAARSGLSIVCATCQRYWEGRDLGRDSCNQPDCGGPVLGRDFPKYVGELPDLQRWCFACGRDSDFSIKVPQGVHSVGVCKEHVRLLQDLVPATPVDGKLILQTGGKFVTLEQIREPTKPTLMQQLIMDDVGTSKS
jgi:hypothetical protein